MDKKSLRLHSLAARRKMSDIERTICADAINTKLLKLVNDNYKKTHVYLSKINEPNTYKFLEYALKSNLEVYVPYVINGEMKTSQLHDTNLRIGTYGIPEPLKKIAVDSNTKYDLIIVPTLAFDLHGNRLGSGKGMYDRFLENQKSALKVGLCFEINKTINIPIEDHDIKLDIAITESNIYRFN
ncbi:5-formyltetrahydrofolate cyclo-ligase [Candidatus Saccharibacteria bacterium]|nr:5-formyltetrahydrofolate cyclo-ligase [Candidatus Saccharibacteria bacterium]